MKIPKLPSPQEWRHDEALTSESAKVLSGDHCQIMIALLQNHGRTLVCPFGSSETDVVRSAGYREGFEACIASLLSFAEFIPKAEELKEEFKDETKSEGTDLWQTQQ